MTHWLPLSTQTFPVSFLELNYSGELLPWLGGGNGIKLSYETLCPLRHSAGGGSDEEDLPLLKKFLAFGLLSAQQEFSIKEEMYTTNNHQCKLTLLWDFDE